MKASTIYVIRKYSMGDVLWVEPLIASLARSYRKVVFVNRYPALFENYPAPNVVFKIRLSPLEKLYYWCCRQFRIRGKFIDLNQAYEANPRCHMLEAYVKTAGHAMPLVYPHLYLSEAEQSRSVVPSRSYAVIHLESLSAKNYRKVFGVNWPRLVASLNERGMDVYQIGNTDEQIAGATYIKTSIRDLVLLMAKARCFIGIDSGPSHVAAAWHIPSVLFFGAVNPAYRHLFDQFNGKILQSPCEYAFCYHTATDGKEVDCRLVGNEGIPKCSVTSNEAVLAALDERLNKQQ